MTDIYGTIFPFSTNNQPMAEFTDDVATVMFRGRIFNHDKLQCVTGSNQAEMVYDIYTRHGISGLGRIDGSFLITITTPECTIIARDRHGTYSQIYYTATHYATGLHRLRDMANGLQPDRTALATFLATGIIPTPHSAFTGVYKLPAGHALIAGKSGKIETIPLNDYGTADIPSTEDEIIKLYGELHRKAICRRIGDNPPVVGMLLSGGYDSGSNLAALRQCYNGEVHTFSIGFRGDAWTELPLARLMSQRFGTRHTEYEITGDEILELPKITNALGDPFVEGGLMVNYAAMRLACGDNLPVILGGDGSDQYFGTAGRELALHRLARRCCLMVWLQAYLISLERQLVENSSSRFKLWFRLASVCNIDDNLFGFKKANLWQIIRSRPEYSYTFKPGNPSWDSLYRRHRLEIDIKKTIDQVILFKASRMADMMGCNMAFPFTDLELRKFLDRLPVDMLCRCDSMTQAARGHLTAKYLLKACYKPLLPPEITSKKKQGGFAPMPLFFVDDARRHRLNDFILSSSVCTDLLRRKGVEKFLRHYENCCHATSLWFWYRQNEAIRYFSLLTLATWWEQYVNNKEVSY